MIRLCRKKTYPHSHRHKKSKLELRINFNLCPDVVQNLHDNFLGELEGKAFSSA